MVTTRWVEVADPESFARRVLQAEAPEIPAALLEGRSWEQLVLPITDLTVDESMVAEHDASLVHQQRRDSFQNAIVEGAELPPLIAIKANLQLIDGYARLRALRALSVDHASVVRQRTP